MFIRATNFLAFRRTSGSKYIISLGNETDFKAKIFNSILCNFSAIHDINKAWVSIWYSTNCKFQKLYNIVYLTKNYGTLPFKDSIQ